MARLYKKFHLNTIIQNDAITVIIIAIIVIITIVIIIIMQRMGIQKGTDNLALTTST